MHIARTFLLAFSCATLTGAVTMGQTAATPPRPAPRAPARPAIQTIASVREIMETMTVPGSNALFSAAADDAPRDDKAWESLRLQALVVAESSNLLLIGSRLRNTGTWSRFAIAQRDAALAAVKASTARNADALSKASDALYDTCTDCHKQYMAQK